MSFTEAGIYVPPKPGFVYVVQMGHTRSYKIGRSVNVPRRMSQFGILPPFPYRLVLARRLPNAVDAEKRLHKRFDHLRTNGEWFQLSSYELEWINLWTLYIQTIDLMERVKTVFDNDPVYVVDLAQYARLFAALSRRYERRTAKMSDHNWESYPDPASDLVSEAVS